MMLRVMIAIVTGELKQWPRGPRGSAQNLFRSCCGLAMTSRGAAAADNELPVADAVGLLLELLEHPAATSAVTTAAVRAPAATFLGWRLASGAVCLVRLLPS